MRSVRVKLSATPDRDLQIAVEGDPSITRQKLVLYEGNHRMAVDRSEFEDAIAFCAGETVPAEREEKRSSEKGTR